MSDTPDPPARAPIDAAALPLPTAEFAEFMKALDAEILAGLQRQHELPPFVIDLDDMPAGANPLFGALDAWEMRRRLREIELQRARMDPGPPIILTGSLKSSLTPSGESRIVPSSQAADSPPGTIGAFDMATLNGLAQHAATTTKQDDGTDTPAAVLTVGRYLLSLFAHAEDAFAIRYGRQVDVLPRYMMTTRVPPGRYTVVKHHRVDGVAYVSVKAARPKVPGGKLDPHVFTRVPVNDVNPVPFWNVFPAAVYGPTAEILGGLAARGFPSQEMALLADHWLEAGFTFAPKRTGEVWPTVPAEEFAAAWLAFFTSDAVKKTPPVSWVISFNVNRANHHPPQAAQ